MNVDLRDVGITLVVGAYVLYGLELIWWWAGDVNLFRTLRKHGIVSETGSVAISLALSFAIGMIMESSTAFIFRDASSPFRAFDGFLMDQVARDSAHGPGGTVETLSLTPLGRELAANGLLTSVSGGKGIGVEPRWCAKGVGADERREFRRAVVRYYYQAKNTAFTDAERQEELLAIQQRMTFVSAFAVCSALLAVVLAVLGLGLMVADAQERLTRWKDGERRRLARLRRPVRGPLAALLGLVLLTGLSWFSYRTEAGEYIRRVLGYYSSDVLETRMRDSTIVQLYVHESCL
jgi:hypothetical protein